MSDQFVQIQPDSTGKKVDVSEVTVGSNTVERQRIVLADNTTATSFASITNSALQVQPIANLMQNFSPAPGFESLDPVNGPTTHVQIDPNGQIMVRGPILTDEGSKRDDFGEEGPWIKSLTGTVDVVTGSKNVVGIGTAFLTEVEEKDYFKITAHAETYWGQIQSATDDTHLVLETAYGGASISGAAGSYTDWPSITTGSGMSATEASSLMTISTGTTSGDQLIVYHDADYLPLSLVTRFYVSQMIANQEFAFGFANNPANMGHFARVVISGTDPHTFTFATGCTSDPAYQQTGTFSMPSGLLTSFNTFRIDLTTDKCTLSVNEVAVAVVTTHLPYPYEDLKTFMYAKNTGTAGSSTNFVFDWIQITNYNQIHLTTQTPINVKSTNTTPGGEGIAPWYATITPNSRLRVSGEPTVIFADNFDAIQLDSNCWSLPTILGAGRASLANGNLSLLTDTLANTAVSQSSTITFAPQGTDFSIFTTSIKLEAVTITNTHRFWGYGTPNPTEFTTSTPLANAVGFEVNTTGALNAVVYSNNTKVFSQALNIPSDGSFHRYRILYRPDQINYYVDTFDIPQARANFVIPAIQALPIRFHMVNGATPPDTAPTFEILAVGISDSANNTIALVDGTYPHRKAKVDAIGNQQILINDGSGSGNTANVDNTGALAVNVTADLDSLKTGSAFRVSDYLRDPSLPVSVKLDRYGKQIGGLSFPVTLASDDIVTTSASVSPVVGGAISGATNLQTIGPIPMQGYTNALVQVSGTFSCTITFEATVDDPINGPWITVAATNQTTGALVTAAIAVSAATAWNVYLPGFLYFRVRATAYTSGIANFKIIRTSTAATMLPAAVTAGGNAAVGSAVSGNTIPVAGADGTTSNLVRQATVTPPGTTLSGLTTNQPNVLLMGGIDGTYTVSPVFATPLPSTLGKARAILLDAIGTVQVNDPDIDVLRAEVRETNGLLVQVLQELNAANVLSDKMPAMVAQAINQFDVNEDGKPSQILSGRMTLTTTAQLLPPITTSKVTIQSSNTNSTNGAIIYIGQPGAEYFELMPGQSIMFTIDTPNIISAYTNASTAILNWIAELDVDQN